MKRRNNNSLLSIDSLYKQAIVYLSEDVRIDYCERLIQRCTFDVRNNIGDKKQLKIALQAAKHEIKSLNEKHVCKQ
ncbi:hypothetical protein [Carboxylicivirga sp. N1Y90]|uniref:hypothetical protein n=1 Tax=Carboxylicivirga fragile TaxID=3417571 RepID=UPI003D340BCF